MCDLIVSVPDYCLSFYFSFLMVTSVFFLCNLYVNQTQMSCSFQ